jgi:hypothetical protein
MEEATRLLMRKEKDQLVALAKDHFALYVGWYNYFSTLNIAAIGWLATSSMNNRAVARIVIGLFIVATALAFRGCFTAVRHFRDLAGRESAIVSSLQEEGSNVIIPIGVYVSVLRLLTTMIGGFLAAWLLFFAFAPAPTRTQSGSAPPPAPTTQQNQAPRQD